MTSITAVDWPKELAAQLSWYWERLLRPRLAGLTDEEYFWEPTPGCWSVRRRGQGVAVEVGGGDFILDFDLPQPEPPPVTTIAWRLNHIIVGVLAIRNASHFGGPPVGYDTYPYAGTARAALDQLDTEVERWLTGVRGLDERSLAAECREAGHETDSMAALVLHIQREVFHHGAEVALLRDLFRARRDQPA